MQTPVQIRNETFAIALVQAGAGTVAFAVLAAIVAAATPLVEVRVFHVLIAMLGMASYVVGRNAFGVASISNDYQAQAVAAPMSKYTVR